jgi:metaxin
VKSLRFAVCQTGFNTTLQIYSVYLSPNATSIAEPLYVLPASNNAFVRLTIAHDLRRAAEQELLKFSAVISSELLYKEAEDAFAALETLLGIDKWFFGASKPSLFDASVFAYTHLLLDDKMNWVETQLPESLSRHRSLVKHRDRIANSYYVGV